MASAEPKGAKYYLLQSDPEVAWGASGAPPALPRDARFLRGRLIRGAVPNPLVVEVDHPVSSPPRGIIEGVVPLVERTLVQLLRAAGADNFQEYAARLVNPQADLSWEHFVAVNVVGIADAVDMERSVYATLIGGGVVPPLVDFDAIVLRRRQTLGLRMFRVAQCPRLWFVDEGVVQALRANRPAGGWGVAVREVDVV